MGSRTWTALRRRLLARPSGPLLLGLDFDGTLAALARSPELSRLPGASRLLLGALSRRSGVRVAVLSGRRLRDVRTKVGLPGLYYAGNHGLELLGPKGPWTHPRAKAALGALRLTARALRRELADFPGASLEDKALSLSLHYRRMSPRLSPSLEDRVREILGPHARRLRLSPGKKVWEIRPRLSWDKGKALLRIRRELGGLWSLMFVGDDATDEEGFRSLGPRALCVRVGPCGNSRAAFILGSRGRMESLLRLLVQETR